MSFSNFAFKEEAKLTDTVQQVHKISVQGFRLWKLRYSEVEILIFIL